MSREKVFSFWPWCDIDSFCLERDFQPSNPAFTSHSAEDFIGEINKNFSHCHLEEGYAPFCRELTVENFTDAPSNVLAITAQNQHLLKTKYEARTKEELPVLIRYFDREDVKQDLQHAPYLLLIFYSKDQIQLEKEALNEKSPSIDIETVFKSGQKAWETVSWSLIAIKPMMTPTKMPMQPITMMRNALGMAQGGNGEPLKRRDYLASVDFWDHHARIL